MPNILNNLRHDAVTLFETGVHAAHPGRAVQQHLPSIFSSSPFMPRMKKCNKNFLTQSLVLQDKVPGLPDVLSIAARGHEYRHAPTAVHLVAVGKAACTMAAAAQRLIHPAKINPAPRPEPSPSFQNIIIDEPGKEHGFLKEDTAPLHPCHKWRDFMLRCWIKSAIVVTNAENLRPIAHFQVIAAGHPFPDEAGLKAGKRILQNLQSLAPNERVLILLSGGASAMLPCPAPGLTLSDKIITSRLLMNNGANIHQLNCVRKHLSAIKGGQLAQYVAPHQLHSLILSDVPDNDLSVIASGPTYADTSTFSEAISILHQLNIWDKVPDSVKQHLIKGRNGYIPETPKLNHPCFNTTENTLIGDNMTCIKAIATKAKALGYRVINYTYPLTGNCRREAEKLVTWCIKNKKTINITKTAIITGGETTVTLTGTGKGGRNQEMALTFALAARRLQLKGKWVFLSAGTDGRDGPTDASGAVVDPQTLSRIPNAAAWLENNDSYHALKQSQDLLQSGATGTNVADIQIALFHPDK